MRFFVPISVLIFSCIALIRPAQAGTVVPPPKLITLGAETLSLSSAEIHNTELYPAEAERLRVRLTSEGIKFEEGGTPITLSEKKPTLPDLDSHYRKEIEKQSYTIRIDGEGVALSGATPEAIFYAIQTFDQLREGTDIPHATITDWPDIPVRMLMVDPARQNENMHYYRRVVDFAARYKMNAIMCHLTDDQTSALYHEDYAPLMHEHAWRADDIRSLVAYAAERHIELIPEIESLGHSRMFTRMDDPDAYLHETDENRPDQSWMGTSLTGYTNVLCPAKEGAVMYLKDMYTQATETFDHPWIHIGFDEVDMTQCESCIAKYGEQTEEEWMAAALAQARDLVKERGKKVALWGDMLLSHPKVVDAITPEEAIIYDWHYGETVDPSSVGFFQTRGFEIVASPALACAPHMNLPDIHNFHNIENFARIARERDLLGINTTVWVPTRYMSDVIWTGMAWAAAHSWGGSNFDEERFYTGFAADYFGSDQGRAYQQIWNSLLDNVWHRTEFNTACWVDEESLLAAAAMATEKQTEINAKKVNIERVLHQIESMTPSIQDHKQEWQRLHDAVRILHYNFEHLLAAPFVKNSADKSQIEVLDQKCQELLAAIDRDWDRNRFADDPGKEGRFLQIQHLRYRFAQMHEYHQELIDGAE